MNRLGRILMHVVMLAIVSAIAAYWIVKILTPQPSAAPPPLAAALPREPNPVLAARMFGLIQAPQATVSNIQVLGVFAAGDSSAAVLAVDGKPPRAFTLGQEVSPGNRLTAVRQDMVVLEGSSGARQELRLPARAAVASLGGSAPPAPAYTLQGNVLSAPSSPGGAVVAPRAATPPMAAPQPAAATAPPPAGPVGIPQQLEQNSPAPPPVQQDAPRQQ